MKTPTTFLYSLHSKQMKQLITIFIGGGLGSITRFLLGKFINTQHNNSFPFGTFIVNIAACFLLGCIVTLASQKQIISPQAKLFWAVGFCGGFSTFSTFSSESLTLFQQGNHLTMFTYIAASVIVCLFATYSGMMITQKIIA